MSVFSACTQVASYDYQLPVLVNGLKAPSPPPSPWPPSNAPSNITLTQSKLIRRKGFRGKHFMLTLIAGFEPSFSQTPIRRVLATVLQSPLLVSNTFLNFSLHPGFLDEEALPIQHQQVNTA